MYARRSDPSSADGQGDWIDDLRVVAAFLTRFPLGRRPEVAPGRLARAGWAFPVVGAGIGLCGGLVFAVAMWLGLSPWLAAVFAIAAQILATGALHEDAAADVADGFGGGGTREAKLTIMRDSRVGAFGVLALILLVAGRLAALAAITDPGAALAALIAAGALSRTLIVGVMRVLPPARGDGLGAAAGRPDQRGVALAFVLAMAVAWLALGLGESLVVLVVAALGAGVLAGLAKRQIGGQTGDVLGACQQIAELLTLTAIAAMAA